VSVLACVTFRLLIASDTGGKSDHGGLLALGFTLKDLGRTLSDRLASDMVEREGRRVTLHLATREGDYMLSAVKEFRIYLLHFFYSVKLGVEFSATR
tara:strand:+ start:180 stop:470 length:291 start_codon:yes stop_codon:yes gene_type:complete